MERTVRCCNRLHRDVVESPSQGGVQQTHGCGTWGCGERGGAWLMAGLGDPKGFFQSWWFLWFPDHPGWKESEVISLTSPEEIGENMLQQKNKGLFSFGNRSLDKDRRWEAGTVKAIPHSFSSLLQPGRRGFPKDLFMRLLSWTIQRIIPHSRSSSRPIFNCSNLHIPPGTTDHEETL